MGDNLHRRVDKAEIPARIAVLILDPRREKGAAGAVQGIDQKVDAALKIDLPVGAVDHDAGG